MYFLLVEAQNVVNNTTTVFSQLEEGPTEYFQIFLAARVSRHGEIWPTLHKSYKSWKDHKSYRCHGRFQHQNHRHFSTFFLVPLLPPKMYQMKVKNAKNMVIVAEVATHPRRLTGTAHTASSTWSVTLLRVDCVSDRKCCDDALHSNYQSMCAMVKTYLHTFQSRNDFLMCFKVGEDDLGRWHFYDPFCLFCLFSVTFPSAKA